MREIQQVHSENESASIVQIESLQDVESLWRTLEANTDSHFFHSWAWISNWLNIVLSVTPIYLFSYRCESQIKAACFLTLCRVTRKKGLVRVTQLQMNEYSHSHYNMINGYSGLLMMAGHEQNAWNYLIQSAQSFSKKWDEFYIGSLGHKQRQYCENAKQALASLVDKQCFVWSKPLPDVSSAQDVFIDTFKRKSRQQLRQTLKAFAECGDVHLEVAETVEHAKMLFQMMEETHTERWVAVGKKGSYANKVWTQFHETLIDRFFQDGLIQLIKVSVGDKAVGYLYGHIYRNKVFMHQTGFPHLEDNRLRSGHLSHFHAMYWNHQQGRSEYDFLPDFANSYKKFFVDAGDEIVNLCLRRKRWIFAWETFIEQLKQRKQKIRASEASDEN